MAADADPFDIVTARLDYRALDGAASPVRLRLNSTAVQVANTTDDEGITVDYVNEGRVLRVSARQAVLACYNAIIPHLAPELPTAQKAALAQCVKRPMLVVNTVLRNGQVLQKLGIKGAQLPGSFLQNVFLVTGVNVGDYHPGWRPEDACVMQSFASFGSPQPGASLASQARTARAQMLAMPFEDYEREVRGVLQSLLGARRIRRGARHPCHHRQPLAARLRARPSRPRGCGLECRTRARGRRAAALRPHRHREFGRRRGRLHARGHRPGVAGGQRPRQRHLMGDPVSLGCPYCGEPVDVAIDEGGGSSQSYVEDCPVCCRPWQVEIEHDPEIGWTATLRTSDE